MTQRGGARILIAAGGSGGHIFPAVALAAALKEERPDIAIRFIGGHKALDRRMFEREGSPFSLLSANKLPYKPSWRFIPFLIRLCHDVVKSAWIVATYRPSVVVGFGGYVPSPVLLAAKAFCVPVAVHEQNVVPGRANMSLMKFAVTVCLSFEETRRHFAGARGKIVVTGNPIRTSIHKEDRAECLKQLDFSSERLTILVIGGSQGAHVLNTTFVRAVRGLGADIRAKLQIIHLTGVKDYEWAVSRYRGIGVPHSVFAFLDNIHRAYSAADLVVTRAGASVIFELALFGKPMLLVPYPYAMSHQAENARVFAAAGAAMVIDERMMTPETLGAEIGTLLRDEARRGRMAVAAKALARPDAAKALAEEVLALVKVP